MSVDGPVDFRPLVDSSGTCTWTAAVKMEQEQQLEQLQQLQQRLPPPRRRRRRSSRDRCCAAAAVDAARPLVARAARRAPGGRDA